MSLSSDLVCLTSESSAAEVLPGLELLPHRVRALPADARTVLASSVHDAVLVDARQDLAGARDLCRLLSTGTVPVLVVVDEGGLVALNAEWGADDFLLPRAGPAEIDARLRLAFGRCRAGESGSADALRVGELLIEEATCTARLRGRALELTVKEFELLKFLAQHAGRVFTRAQLLSEVWGHDFFGGTRTVDVHIRRLRAKLGPEHDSMIGTVRGVGYKFVKPARGGHEDGVIGAEHAVAERAERPGDVLEPGGNRIATSGRLTRATGTERTR